MVVLVEKSNVRATNELSVTHQKHGRPHSSKDNALLKRKIKDQDPVWNNTWAINALILLESPIPEDLTVREETQIPKEIVTPEGIRKTKIRKSPQIILI